MGRTDRARPGAFAAACVVVGLAACIAACGDGESAAREVASNAGQAIIGGAPDTSHGAVVALFNDTFALNGTSLGYRCTGTIFHVAADTGYVVTAAHCMDIANVVIGDVYTDVISYPVRRVSRHPGFLGGSPALFDIAVVEFTGATEATPVIALASDPDGLAPGTPIAHLGYGVKDDGKPSRERLVATSTLRALVGDYAFDYDDAAATPCSGDSGGPQLAGSPERVVGITHGGADGCTGHGLSGRVSTLSRFTQSVIDRQTFELSCSECTATHAWDNGQCAIQMQACNFDLACAALNECYNLCGGVSPCMDQCDAMHPMGLDAYAPLRSCTCEVGCVNECSQAVVCGGPGPTESSEGDAEADAAACSASARPRNGRTPGWPMGLVVGSVLALRTRRSAD